MKVIVINGSGGAGKDLFVKLFQSFYPDTFNISMIDAVKHMAIDFGWDKDKDEAGRRFLSDLKDVWERYNDGPYEAITWRIEQIQLLYNLRNKDTKSLIIFVHAREPKDIERLVSDYNAYTILIRRPATDGRFHNHADANVTEWDYDFVYDNVGTVEEMKQDVQLIADYINELDFESKPKEA